MLVRSISPPLSRNNLHIYMLTLVLASLNCQVLRILEGDMVESGCISAPSSVAGSMSRRMMSDRQHYQEQSSPVQPKDVNEVNRSYETLRSAWDSDRQELSDRFWYPSAADCSRPR
jgi:hypothetical protein